MRVIGFSNGSAVASNTGLFATNAGELVWLFNPSVISIILVSLPSLKVV